MVRWPQKADIQTLLKTPSALSLSGFSWASSHWFYKKDTDQPSQTSVTSSLRTLALNLIVSLSPPIQAMRILLLSGFSCAARDFKQPQTISNASCTVGPANSDQIPVREEGAQVTVKMIGEQIKSACKSFAHIILALIHLLNLLHAAGTAIEKEKPTTQSTGNILFQRNTNPKEEKYVQMSMLVKNKFTKQQSQVLCCALKARAEEEARRQAQRSCLQLNIRAHLLCELARKNLVLQIKEWEEIILFSLQALISA